LFCKRGPISANLYFENIGDIEYYTGSESSLAVFPGAPFNVRGTVGLTY